MTDALDRLAGPAADLLDRVDTTLTRCGAPADHAIWPLLRRVGALPGEVVGAIAALRPGPLAAAGMPLRALIRRYGDAAVAGPVGWRGAAADRFADQWTALRTHLDGDAESLTGRLAATAGYLDAVADWLAEGREALARTLASALISAEAVAVRTAAVGAPLAAADLAAYVLAAVAGLCDDGGTLPGSWAPRLAELPFRPPPGDVPAGPEQPTEVVP
jgi:hypothetical protein